VSDNPFVKTISSFKTDLNVVAQKGHTLITFRDDLITKLKNNVIPPNKLSKESELVKLSEGLSHIINDSITNWMSGWDASTPMRELSEQYSDRIILLVFGKVNAGKSSFCNSIIELFSDEQIKRFYLEDGEVKYTKDKFKEGVTETTARIQGVELANNLVLLDTPGLHSVTDVNGDLTKIFTDSADAILWLTPSTSPGQVQELNDLKTELEQRKPLLPVITRSDFLEDDIDENDCIVQILKNKSRINREEQEKDVRKRATTALDEEIEIKVPISISVHSYKQSNGDQEGLDISGLTRLYSDLGNILNEAKVYKVEKASQQVINYFDRDILSSLTNVVQPQISKLIQSAKETVSNLNAKKVIISKNLVADVCSLLPEIVEKYKVNSDVAGLSGEVNTIIESSLNTKLQVELDDYVTSIQNVASDLSADSLGEFQVQTADIKIIKGSSGKSISSGIGGIGAGTAGAYYGGLAGTAFIPIPVVGTAIGGAIGGLLGGLLGSAAGDYVGETFVETETVTEVVGVDSAQVLESTMTKIQDELPILVEGVINDVISSINAAGTFAEQVQKLIDDFKDQVEELKR
jgi:predicted GTPase